MKIRRVAILFLILASSPIAYAGEYINPSDTAFVPIPVVLVHGMSSAPNTWTTLTEKLQPLVQSDSFATPSANFRYALPRDTPELEPKDTRPAAPDSSYFQTVHFGRHGVFQGILDSNQDTITDPMLALEAISVRDEGADDIRSVLESVNAALKLQKNLGVAPDRRFVILVGHSTGGLAIRKFVEEMGAVSPGSPQGDPALSDMAGITYESVVKRIVFVDVPHRGSPLGNYIAYSHDALVSLDGGSPAGTVRYFKNNAEISEGDIDSALVLNGLRHGAGSTARAWCEADSLLVGMTLGGPLAGPIFSGLSVPEDITFSESVVAKVHVDFPPDTITGQPPPPDDYRAEWTISKTYYGANCLLANLHEAPSAKCVNIAGRSVTARETGLWLSFADDAEEMGELMEYGMSGGVLPEDPWGWGGSALVPGVIQNLGTLIGTLPPSTRQLNLSRPSGDTNFSYGYRLDQLEFGDGIVTESSQIAHPSLYNRIADGWAHAPIPIIADGATENWEAILGTLWDKPATVDTICASQYIDPSDSALKSYLIFSIDDLYPADASLVEGPKVVENISGQTYDPGPLQTTPTSTVWSANHYGTPNRLQSVIDPMSGSPLPPKIQPLSTYNNPDPLNPEFWPYGALGDTLFRRRVTALKAPNGETVQLGPGQFAVEMAFLSQNAKETGEFSLTVSGRTRNVISRETTFNFPNVAAPPYVEAVTLTAANGESQNGGVAMRHNSPGSHKDTWSRVVTGDTRLQGMSGDITIRVTFNQPFARDSVSMYLWNGTDTPKITLTPITGQQDRTLTGTIASETLAHTKVGVYPLAISCTGPNPLAPHVDGNPMTIAWYNPVKNEFDTRGYENGPDTLHRFFVAPTFVAGLIATSEARHG